MRAGYLFPGKSEMVVCEKVIWEKSSAVMVILLRGVAHVKRGESYPR